MSFKEKLILMVVGTALILVVMTFARLSDDALGLLIGVVLGMSIGVPALAVFAWQAGKNHAQQQRPTWHEPTARPLPSQHPQPRLPARQSPKMRRRAAEYVDVEPLEPFESLDTDTDAPMW